MIGEFCNLANSTLTLKRILPSLSVESLIMIFPVSGEVALSSLSIIFSILSSWLEEFSFSIAICSTCKQAKINSYAKYLCYIQNNCSIETNQSTNISDFIFQRLINLYYFNYNTLYRFWIYLINISTCLSLNSSSVGSSEPSLCVTP